VSILPASGDHIPMAPAPGLMPHVSEEALWLARVWHALRHHWLLIAAGTVVGIALAVFLTSRATPIYQATASLQILDRQPNLPEIFKTLSTGGEISTDIEVLRSRALVDVTVSALGLRLRVLEPKRVPRATLFSTIQVDGSAPAGLYRFQLQDDDRYIVTDATDGTTLGFAARGAPIVLRGMRLALSRTAPRLSVIVLEVVPASGMVDAVRQALRINQASSGADVVALTFQDSDPVVARQVPNMVMARFIARRQNAMQAEARGTADFLREQLVTVSAQLAAAEDTMRGFRERERVIDPQTEASSQVTRLVTKESERSGLEAERAAFAQTLEQVTAQATAQREPGSPSPYRQLLAFPTLLRNQAATTLMASLDNVENERTSLLVRRTKDDPDVKVLSNRIAEIEDQLHGIALTYLDGLTNQVGSLDTALSDFKRELSTLPRKEVNFSRLERKTKGLEDVYTLLQTRLKQAEIQQGVTDPSVQVVDSATTPLRPSQPRRGLNLLMGIMGGLLLGCVGAFIREYGDKSIRSRHDILAATGLPVLGLIPEIRRPSGRIALVTGGGRYVTPWRAESPALPAAAPPPPPSKTVSRARYTFFNADAADEVVSRPEPAPAPAPEDLRPILRVAMSVPGRAAAEAYATLQTNIVFSRTDRAVKVLVVTSALPGDGKTTCATNLALTLTQRGIKTLVIDADLRRGMINRAFDSPLEPGLANVLLGTTTLKAALRKMEVGETRALMHYLTAGTRADNPTGLIESERMRTLIGELSAEYDRIIIDTPPVNAVTDAALLGSWADGVILIARAGVTERPALAYAVDQLRRVRAPLLGVVLNAIDFRRDAAYDNAYRYYDSEEYLNAAAE
jgi:capsular exopolysaccharide synthesis family protein